VWKNVLICLLAASLAASLILRWRDRVNDTPPAPLQTALGEALARALGDTEAGGMALGLCVQDEAGNTIFGREARRAFIPASSLKTLTTATALELLGPDFHFQTRLLSAAPMAEGVIEGDLILRGGGDPMLSLADLSKCAAELQARGLREVRGRVLGDGGFFTGSIYGDFWNWGDIGNGYGSPVSGLNLEHNRYTAVFAPALQEGGPAAFVGAQPEVPGITWLSEVRTGPEGGGDGVMIHGGERAQRVHLRGTVPAGQPQFRVAGAVPAPELFAAHHLRAALMQAGIRVAGGAASAREAAPMPEAGHEMWRHESPALADIVTSIHATSDNHETECVFRMIGAREKRPPAEVVRAHWQTRGLTFEGLRMEDGCGLARADHITPHDLARLQMLAATGPQGRVYADSLLAAHDGAVRYKGGAMSGVRSVAGLVTRPDGSRAAFALMVNHFGNPRPYALLREAMLRALADVSD